MPAKRAPSDDFRPFVAVAQAPPATSVVWLSIDRSLFSSKATPKPNESTSVAAFVRIFWYISNAAVTWVACWALGLAAIIFRTILRPSDAA